MKHVYLLIGIGLILRLCAWYAYFQHNPLMIAFDSGHYHTLAISLSKAQGFVDDNKQPSLYRLPGYPLFLAGCYALCKQSTRAAIIFQICLSVALVPLTMALATVFFPALPGVSSCAGLLSAIAPGYIIYSNLLMSETLFLFFFLLFLYLFSQTFFLDPHDRPRRSQDDGWVGDYTTTTQSLLLTGQPYGLAGIFLGIASLIRPVGHLLLPLVILFVLVFGYDSFTRRVKQSAVLIAGWFCVVFWWLLRNYLLTGMIVFHTLSGPHFLNHLAVKIVMNRDRVSYTVARQIISQEITDPAFFPSSFCRPPEPAVGGRRGPGEGVDIQPHISLASLRQVIESRQMERYTHQLICQHPIIALKIMVVNMVKTVLGLYSSEFLVIESAGKLPPYESNWSIKSAVNRFLFPPVSWPIRAVMYYELLFMLVLMIGSCGFWVKYAWCTPRQAIITFTFVLFFVGISCACGFARLRFPIEWCLMLWASRWWQDGVS